VAIFAAGSDALGHLHAAHRACVLSAWPHSSERKKSRKKDIPVCRIRTGKTSSQRFEPDAHPMTLPFLILAVMTLAGAVAAMTLRMLVHSVLALTITFAGLAALYIQLGAQFVGLAQILVYIGAVAILIVFAILLTREQLGHSRPGDAAAPLKSLIASGAVTAVVFGVLAWAMVSSEGDGAVLAAPQQVTVKQIGGSLLERFVLPLEVIGLMLTAALIGAVILALEETQSTK
jgi:NADH-quinone oxidoreductase subunit J